MARSKSSKMPSGYFKRVSFLTMVLGVVCPGGLFMAWLYSEAVPANLGLVTVVINWMAPYAYLVKIAGTLTIMAHILEGMVAVALCIKYGLTVGVTCLWFTQTLIYGFFSLKKLIFPPKSFAKRKD